ncbi:MAG: hypothetical protein D6732_20740 [Methanobacteriota archaeon]|nr:MAG: hypothetical protein D6732_20740 [Euryarchaeota archaeon]
MKDFVVDHLPGSIVRFFSRPYVGGYGIDAALKKAEELWTNERISTTLDLLGEFVKTKEEVENTVSIYKDVFDRIKDKNDHISVSIKLSALGILFDREYCESKLEELLKVADERGIKVTMDMEDSSLTETTLEIYRKFVQTYPSFGTVLQSRLFRTREDIERFKDIKGRFRICIGIYNEPPDISLTDKKEMKEKLLEYAKMLLESGHYTEIATHDKTTIERAKEIVKDYPPSQFEFQQLLGVPLLSVQRELVRLGYTVRLYLPFVINKKDATAYLKRRMKENPHMTIYVLKNLLRLN